MAYSEKVIDHYENPRNVGTLDKNEDDVGTGLVGAPECDQGADARGARRSSASRSSRASTTPRDAR